MQFSRARAMAAVAMQKMQYEETKLLHMNTIPTSLEEALAAQTTHKQFQHSVEVCFGWAELSGFLLFAHNADAKKQFTEAFLVVVCECVPCFQHTNCWPILVISFKGLFFFLLLILRNHQNRQCYPQC